MKAIVSFLLITNTIGCFAQDKVFTLNPNVPSIYQPAYAAIDDDASFGFVNQRTIVASGISYQQNVLSLEAPFRLRQSGRRLGGASFNVIQKDAGSGDLLKALNAGLSIAYNLPINKDQTIGFGVQSAYVERKTSLDQLTTGSQWLASEFRFDPRADLGETITHNRIQYLSINAGAVWRWQDHVSTKTKVVAGISAFDLNRPSNTFLSGSSKVPASFLSNICLLVYKGRRVEVWPSLYYFHSVARKGINLLVNSRLLFENENPYDIIRSGSVELITQFDFQYDLSLGLMINQPGLSLGFSYNFAVTSSASQPFSNATAFGIRLFKTFWKPKASTITIANTSISTKRNFDRNDTGNNAGNSPQQHSDVDVIQENIKNISKVTSVRFELDKDFKFGFGKAELSPEAKLYLDDLYKLLEANREYNLEIIGHTDNVGKPLVNYRLSATRAQAVANYLEAKGLSRERIKHSGRGDTEPLVKNETEQDRAKNRRVHFVIYVNR